MNEPISALLHSRKFLLAVTDAIASTVLLLATRFLSPPDVELVKQIVVIYQPVIVAVIAGIAWEDGKEKAAAMVATGARLHSFVGSSSTSATIAHG